MSFSAQITQWGQKAGQKIQRVRKGVTIKLFNAVILDTPVLTGRLRANWRLQVGAPELAPLESFDKSGGSAMRAVEAGVEPTTGDQPIFLANNLPYAHKIEFEGWSHTKAPEGMVRKNVARFGRLISVVVNSK